MTHWVPESASRWPVADSRPQFRVMANPHIVAIIAESHIPLHGCLLDLGFAAKRT
jgi:hypothetical protein